MIFVLLFLNFLCGNTDAVVIMASSGCDSDLPRAIDSDLVTVAYHGYSLNPLPISLNYNLNPLSHISLTPSVVIRLQAHCSTIIWGLNSS